MKCFLDYLSKTKNNIVTVIRISLNHSMLIKCGRIGYLATTDVTDFENNSIEKILKIFATIEKISRYF